MNHQAPDYLAEIALIEVSRLQREAAVLFQWRPKPSMIKPVYEPRKPK